MSESRDEIEGNIRYWQAVLDDMRRLEEEVKDELARWEAKLAEGWFK